MKTFIIKNQLKIKGRWSNYFCFFFYLFIALAEKREEGRGVELMDCWIGDWFSPRFGRYLIPSSRYLYPDITSPILFLSLISTVIIPMR